MFGISFSQMHADCCSRSIYTHDGGISYTDQISKDKGANAKLLQQHGELSNCIWERKFLDMELSWKWIGRSRLVTCSLHSFDIIPLDFFFWEYIKNDAILPLILLEISRKISAATICTCYQIRGLNLSIGSYEMCPATQEAPLNICKL